MGSKGILLEEGRVGGAHGSSRRYVVIRVRVISGRRHGLADTGHGERVVVESSILACWRRGLAHISQGQSPAVAKKAYRGRAEAVVLGGKLGYRRRVSKARRVAIVLYGSCRRTP